MDNVPHELHDDNAGYEPTAEDLAFLANDDDTPLPDWVEDEPEPFDELEQERALSRSAREQAARHEAWVADGRPSWPHSDCERSLDRYLIRPELAAWLAYSGGHERP